MPRTILLCRANMFTELLPRKDREIHSPIQSSPVSCCWSSSTPWRDSWLHVTVWRLWEPSDHRFGGTYTTIWDTQRDSQTSLWYDTDRMENDESKNPSIVACILCRGNAFTCPLPSNNTYIHSHRLMGEIYEVLNFWMNETVFMILGMYIVTPKPISTAYFTNPSHQSVCLHVYPSIVVRQRLGKNVTATMNTHATFT
jgi:hypothetical protein